MLDGRPPAQHPRPTRIEANAVTLEPQTHDLDHRDHRLGDVAGRGPGHELQDPRKKPGTQDRAPLPGVQPAVPARDGRAAGAGHHSRQQGHRPAERRSDFPGDAGGDPRRAKDGHLRNLHLLVWRDRQEIRRGAGRACARGRHDQGDDRLGRQHQDGGQHAAGHEGCRDRCAAVPAVEVVQPRPPQQPHPPQAAGGGWPGRFHRRCRHRRPVGWQSPGSRPLAGPAFPHRGPCRGAGAGGIQRQLDQDHRRGAERRGLLPTAGARGRYGRAHVRGFSRGRQREHAPDVPDGDRRRGAQHRP